MKSVRIDAGKTADCRQKNTKDRKGGRPQTRGEDCMRKWICELGRMEDDLRMLACFALISKPNYKHSS